MRLIIIQSGDEGIDMMGLEWSERLPMRLIRDPKVRKVYRNIYIYTPTGNFLFARGI